MKTAPEPDVLASVTAIAAVIGPWVVLLSFVLTSQEIPNWMIAIALAMNGAGIYTEKKAGKMTE